MFGFMNYDMPSVFGSSSMRSSARPTYRRADPWDLLYNQQEPSYYYQPRQSVVTNRHRPSYYNNEDEDYTRYEQQRRAPRASLGSFGRPQSYHHSAEEEGFDAVPQAVPAFRGSVRQPESYRHLNQNRAAYNHDEDIEEETQRPSVNNRRPQPTFSQPSSSFWNEFRPEPLNRGAQTTRHQPQGNTSTSQAGEKAPFTSSRKTKADATKAQNKPAAKQHKENVETNTSHKAAQSDSKSQNTPSKSAKAAHAGQTVGGKIVIKQDKGDLVVIEDVTPAQPKRDPAMEPAKGLVIEEVNPSQN